MFKTFQREARALSSRPALQLENFERRFVVTHRGPFVLTKAGAFPLSAAEQESFTTQAKTAIDLAERNYRRLIIFGVVLAAFALILLSIAFEGTPWEGSTGVMNAVLMVGGVMLPIIYTVTMQQFQLAQLDRQIERRVARREMLPREFIAERAGSNPYRHAASAVAIAVVMAAVGFAGTDILSTGRQMHSGVFTSQQPVDLSSRFMMACMPLVIVAWILALLGRWRDAQNRRKSLAVADLIRQSDSLTSRSE